jgi:hypothetical protein
VSEKDDFISFEKALRDLKLKSEELRKLVSEGEIRAFRDGPDSMKFRREDIETLASKSQDDGDLTSSLEDDTGMVTEQLSNEDTLIDDSEPEESPKAQKRAARPAPTRAPAMAGAGVGEKEPGWVTAAAIVGCIVMFWGFLISYSISQDSDPAGNSFTSAFSEK